MVPVVSFSGFSEGEEFLNQVIKVLSGKGYRVGILREGSINFDFQSAEAVGFLGKNLSFYNRAPKGLKNLIFTLFKGCDLVFSEFPIEGAVKLYFKRSEVSLPNGRSFTSPETLALYLEDLFPKDKEEITLFVNGREIPMKAYVRETLREILFGFIKPLKGIDWPVEELEVRVIRKRKR